MPSSSGEGNRCVEEARRSLSSPSSRSSRFSFITEALILLTVTVGALTVVRFTATGMHQGRSTQETSCTTVTQPTAPKAQPSK